MIVISRVNVTGHIYFDSMCPGKIYSLLKFIVADAELLMRFASFVRNSLRTTVNFLEYPYPPLFSPCTTEAHVRTRIGFCHAHRQFFLCTEVHSFTGSLFILPSSRENHHRTRWLSFRRGATPPRIPLATHGGPLTGFHGTVPGKKEKTSPAGNTRAEESWEG